MLGAIFSHVCFAEEQPTAEQLISPEEFVSSPAAEFFKSEDYDQALVALEPLIQKYPKDSLLLRYRAMSLDRLGRSEEAIRIYRDILKNEPENFSIRYYLGQAYERSGQRSLAEKEWRAILENTKEEPYSGWSKEALNQVGVSLDVEKVREKRLFLTGRYGYELDSNVILRPSNEALSGASKQSAGRQLVDLALRYRALRSKRSSVDIVYGVSHSFHDNGLDEFDFMSHNLGVDAKHKVLFGGQDVTLGARYDFSAAFLDGNTFSLKNRFIFSADTRLTTYSRSVLSYELAPTNFGTDGSNPSQTSRDGVYHEVGVTHWWYYAQDYKRYLFAQGAYNHADTKGFNFDENGVTGRLGWHTPVVPSGRVDFDASIGLSYSDYPSFISLSSLDTNKRRDLNWDTYTALTCYITPKIGVRGFYRYIQADNDNGFFEYNRNIGGVHLLFAEAF